MGGVPRKKMANSLSRRWRVPTFPDTSRIGGRPLWERGTAAPKCVQCRSRNPSPSRLRGVQVPVLRPEEALGYKRTEKMGSQALPVAGDLILFQGSTVAGLFITTLDGGCPWSHVGLVISVGEEGPLVLECTPNHTGLLDVIDGTRDDGVMVVRLDEKLASGMYSRAAFRSASPESGIPSACGRVATELNAIRYEKNRLRIAKAGYDGAFGENVDYPGRKTMFCTELVATVLRYAYRSGMKASDFNPDKSASEYSMSDLAYPNLTSIFGREQELALPSSLENR